MPAIVVAPPAKPPFDDEESRRIRDWIVERALERLARSAESSPSGRAEVIVKFVARGKKLSLESYVQPGTEHPAAAEQTG